MLQGSIVAIVTPMHADESLDEPTFRSLLDFHIKNGTDGIVVAGTTGESATVDMDEHCRLIEIAIQHVAKRVPVIAGTGSNSTREAIDLTRCAHQAGADACLLVTPYYNKPTQEGLYRHYKAIAEAVPVPQILYNVPGRTACDLLPATVARLAAIDNIAGLKDATGDLPRVAEHRAACGQDFALYSGDDATAMDFMLLGGNGVISVTSNIAPRAMHDMCQAALAGNREQAAAINDKLMGLHRKLFVEPNPIPAKWALQKMGLIGEGIRLPLTPLSEEHQAVVQEAMQQAGVI